MKNQLITGVMTVKHASSLSKKAGALPDML
jgi:hypothetical protein